MVITKNSFNVSIHAGILLIASGQTDITTAKALGYRDDVIQIYSNSWGPSDTGFIVDGPGKLTERVLAAGAQEVPVLVKFFLANNGWHVCNG